MIDQKNLYYKVMDNMQINRQYSRNLKVPKLHFEMALNKVKQLVSEPHELFFYCLHRSG